MLLIARRTPYAIIGLSITATNVVGVFSSLAVYNDGIFGRLIFVEMSHGNVLTIIFTRGFYRRLHEYQRDLTHGHYFIFGLFCRLMVFSRQVVFTHGFTHCLS